MKGPSYEVLLQDFHTLVIRAQDGDLDAYGALVRQFQDLAVGYAFSILGDFHLAEDVAQESFVAGYHTLPQLRDAAAFSGWFRKVVFKHCDRVRRRTPLATISAEVLNAVASDEPTPDILAEKADLRTRVRQAIRALPKHEREAVTLFYMSGYSQQEVGAFLSVPVSTVKNRLRSARHRLRDDLIDLVDGLHQVRPSRDDEFKERTMHAIVDPNLEQAVRDTIGKPTGEFDIIDVRDNPLGQEAMDIQIPALEERGIIVLRDGHDSLSIEAEPDQAGMVEIVGVMKNAQPNGRFEVVLENGEKGLWYISEKMRKYHVAIGIGDRVTVRFDPESPEQGRIVYRHLPSLIED